MYSNVQRDNKYINRLSAFLKCEYGFSTVKLTPAKRGFYGETWRIDVKDSSYFIKLVYTATHSLTYERSFLVIHHLCNHGIDFISRIVQTKDGGLSTCFDGAVLGVFDWINGDNMESDETKIPEYQMLAKVYTVPIHGIPIPCEDFTDKHAIKFLKQWSVLEDKQLISLLEKHRNKIEHRANKLRYVCGLCRGDTSGYVITHGDAGGNFVTDGVKHYIVDWDNPLLAPPERDAWVMCSHDWAREAFQNALYQNGISYTLQPKRLAFYCYDFFFFYLTAFLDAFAQADTVEEYLEGWIKNSFEYADKQCEILLEDKPGDKQ